MADLTITTTKEPISGTASVVETERFVITGNEDDGVTYQFVFSDDNQIDAAYEWLRQNEYNLDDHAPVPDDGEGPCLFLRGLAVVQRPSSPVLIHLRVVREKPFRPSTTSRGRRPWSKPCTPCSKARESMTTISAARSLPDIENAIASVLTQSFGI